MNVHFSARALLPVVLIAGIVALAAAGSLFGAASGVAADRPTFDMHRGVLLSTRENLKICVQPDSSDARGEAVASVRAAVARLNSDPVFRAARYDTPAWQVALNCPLPGRLLTSGERHAKAGGSYVDGPEATSPSPFRLFVYVVPSSEIERMFGSLPFHYAGQEYFCEVRQCGSVTTALYVDANTLRDEARLVYELEGALGLRPAFPPDRSGGPNGPKEFR